MRRPSGGGGGSAATAAVAVSERHGDQIAGSQAARNHQISAEVAAAGATVALALGVLRVRGQRGLEGSDGGHACSACFAKASHLRRRPQRSAKFVYSNLKLIVLASANGNDGTATQGYDAVEYFSLAATADGVKGDPAFSCNNPYPNPKQFAHSE
jgi:hypothetical protein